MPYFENEIDIEPWEYIQACTPREISELIEALEEDGYLKANSQITQPEITSVEWDNMLTKIMENKHQLTVEEETILTQIFNKLV